jgi:hypothetical protein
MEGHAPGRLAKVQAAPHEGRPARASRPGATQDSAVQQRDPQGREKTLNSKSARVLLTELGVKVAEFPEGWVTRYDALGEMLGIDDWAVVDAPDTLRIPELGVTMTIVDGPEVNSSLEVKRDTIWRNIRGAFDQLDINFYVFNDRIEMRGHIPAERIDLPQEADRSLRRGAIIGSARGSGGPISAAAAGTSGRQPRRCPPAPPRLK